MSVVDRTQLPPLLPSPSFAFPEVRRARLPNGLLIRTVEHRDVPVVACSLLFPVGASADPPARPGLAALTADLLDESSGGRSTLEVHRALDGIGAHCDVEIGSDATLVNLTTLARFRERGLALVADMVARPGLRDEDVARVRELRLHRLLQLRDQPGAAAERAFVKVLYGDHPYGHLAIGTEASLQQVTRDEVASFHHRQYVPSGATLIIVGDASHEEMVASAGAVFEGWQGSLSSTPQGDSSAIAPEGVPEMGGVPRGRLFVVHRPGATQSELRVGHVAVARDTPDFHPLLVLNALLGGQFVSRLNLNLREDKGFTYGVRSAFEFRRHPGPFVVQTSVQTDATTEATAEVVSEIQAIRSTRPPAEGELDLAKAGLTRGFPRGFETAEQVSRGVGQLVLYDLPDDYFSQFASDVQRVGIDDVCRAAQQHLTPERLSVVIVGDRDRLGPSLHELELGDPIELDGT